MKHIITLFTSLFFCIGLMGCQEMTNQDVGTVAGGVAGGLLGSTVGQGGGQLVGIAAGTLAGAYLGGAIGRNMDANDRRQVNSALENNAAGQPAYWRNRKSGASYEVVPTKNVTVRGNEYCREYRTIVDIGGKKREMYGTACRKPDGSWKSVS